MLIKTADPSRQMEKMLQKSAWRRRMAHRQCVAEQAAAPTAAVPGTTMQPRAPQHAKPRSAVARKPGAIHAPRFGGDMPPGTVGGVSLL